MFVKLTEELVLTGIGYKPSKKINRRVMRLTYEAVGNEVEILIDDLIKYYLTLTSAKAFNKSSQLHNKEKILYRFDSLVR